MRSLEMRINAVEQVLKSSKTGWALRYWNDVLRDLNNMRDVNYYELEMSRSKQSKKSIFCDV